MKFSAQVIDYGHGVQIDGDNELLGKDQRRMFVRIPREMNDPTAIMEAARELRRFAQWMDNMAAKEREKRS